MPKQIRLNAFDMNCVGHQSPGLWTHPRDRSDRYNTLDYWVELAMAVPSNRSRNSSRSMTTVPVLLPVYCVIH